MLLDWAADESLARGCELLRSSCDAWNTRLRSYYQSLGFVSRGEVEVHGTPAARYERSLVAA